MSLLFMRVSKKLSIWMTSLVILISTITISSTVYAEEAGEFKAVPGQIGFMQPATPVMEELVELHDTLMIIMTLVTLFVTVMLGYIIVKFRAKKNPKASNFTHHTALEVTWTMVPILILLVIAVPAFKILYQQDVIPKADVTVKAIGNQWYWTYEYPDVALSDDPEDGALTFNAYMLSDEEAKSAAAPRLLATDNIVVVPINKVVKVIVTATDVIHAWAIPAFGVKIDAVPGRLNETWFKATKLGLFYGQCSELCGIKHGFMPINVKVVTLEEYKIWLTKAKVKFASNDVTGVLQVASAQ
jgi:cytochrome c oxidase subunit 2